MRTILLLILIAIFFEAAPAKSQSLSPEQQKYCDWAQEENVPCNKIKKKKLASTQTRQIAVGCEGPGFPVQHCGAHVYFYRRTGARSNPCTTGSVSTIEFDEEWTFSYTLEKASSTIFWKDGKFVYDAYIASDFSGFQADSHKFREAMGKDRTWFNCAVVPY